MKVTNAQELTKRIEYLESLVSDLRGYKYIKHVKRIKDRIEMWKNQIEQEELDIICRKLYQ